MSLGVGVGDAADPFELVVPSLPPFVVRELEGTEALSGSFHYRVVAITTASFAEIRTGALGEEATLRKGSRHLTGIITSIRVLAYPSEAGVPTTSVALQLESPLHRLKTRSTSRIFQDQGTLGVADALLFEWRIPHRFAIAREHAPRAYIVQRGETDWELLRRTLADDGVYFFFVPPQGDEPQTLIVSDNPAPYRPDAERLPRALRYAPGSSGSADADAVLSFESEVAARPQRVLVRDYDPTRAEYDLVARAGTSAETAPNGAQRSATPHVYEYLPARPLTGDDKVRAARELELLGRDHETIRATLTTAELGPGGTFVLLDHPVVLPTQAWLVTELRDTWRRTGDGAAMYRAEVVGLPAEATFVPERLRAPRAEGLDLAVVIAPDGQSLDTDTLGRVRVRFHWDDDRPDLAQVPDDSRRSCWLRVSQPWAGSGFGAQFIPRAGTEVLVGFLQGDVNRPIIVGSLTTSSNPPVFPLPTSALRSGLGSDTAAGRSEITVDDATDQERVRVVGARDVELRAGRDLVSTVGGDRASAVYGSDSTIVGNDASIEVGANASARVTGDATLVVGGRQQTEISGASRTKILGATQLDAAGGLDARVAGDAVATFEGPTLVTFEEEHVEIHRKDASLLFGLEDTPVGVHLQATGVASVEAKQRVELRSDTSIHLACGDSLIVIDPQGITLQSKKVRVEADVLEAVGTSLNVEASDFIRASGERVLLLSAGASLAMGREVKIKGDKIRLGTPPDAIDGPEAARGRPAPTRIELRDQTGQPFAFEWFVIVRANGERRYGRLDEEGKAIVLDLDGSCTIDFPGLPNFRKE